MTTIGDQLEAVIERAIRPHGYEVRRFYGRADNVYEIEIAPIGAASDSQSFFDFGDDYLGDAVPV